MPNPKPPYPPEFRAEVVRLARSPGNPIRQVARDLGISKESVRPRVHAELRNGGTRCSRKGVARLHA